MPDGNPIANTEGYLCRLQRSAGPSGLSRIHAGTRDGLESLHYRRSGSLEPFTDESAVGAAGFFKYFVFDNPNWNFLTWNYDKDMPFTDKKLASEINATDPDLKPFRAHGGSCCFTTVGQIPEVSPLETIEYYENMVANVSGTKTNAPGHETLALIDRIKNTEDFARLFMVPGMDHCGGGPARTCLTRSGLW